MPSALARVPEQRQIPTAAGGLLLRPVRPSPGATSNDPYAKAVSILGTSEAFLHAVANENQFKQSNDMLLLFSVIYIILNVVLIKSSRAVGLIAANSINMLLRITYSAIFIKGYFKGSFSFRRCVPAGWGILPISGLTTVFSERVFLNKARFKQTVPIHISVGSMCLSIASFKIYHGEKQFLR